MAAIRRNILKDRDAREGYVEGVRRLKRELSGTTTRELGIPGTTRELSTFDLFVFWHQRAMSTFTPPSQGDRNAAHRGPCFLPWHRFMLIFFEAQLQRVLRDRDFGLPYWAWQDDGELTRAKQRASRLWADDCMGGDGDPAAGGAVSSGPFSEFSGWRVLVASDSNGVLRSVSRPLRRRLSTTMGLPRKSQVRHATGQADYDTPPWTAAVPDGMRNRLEGWVPGPTAPHLHNRVHVWVHGDMFPSSSPNDPVFYLNHCNVDRIWASWLDGDPAVKYLPGPDAPATLAGHRLNDPLFSIFTARDDTRWTPRQMLDVSNTYSYDSLQVS